MLESDLLVGVLAGVLLLNHHDRIMLARWVVVDAFIGVCAWGSTGGWNGISGGGQKERRVRRKFGCFQAHVSSPAQSANRANQISTVRKPAAIALLELLLASESGRAMVSPHPSIHPSIHPSLPQSLLVVLLEAHTHT
jgi:hypothetical protein